MTLLFESIQGDTSGCAKPPVDFKTKVLFWPGLELLFWSQQEVLHNLMCHRVLFEELNLHTNPHTSRIPLELRMSADPSSVEQKSHCEVREWVREWEGRKKSTTEQHKRSGSERGTRKEGHGVTQGSRCVIAGRTLIIQYSLLTLRST